ncbi:MAG TPA: hypothetical protein VJP77_09300, partial [Planctomycetota bacterium]|nr:hypothetical protein [Planctomycetota bacterium]
GATGGGEEGLPGALNPNFAPRAVLFALSDERAVPTDFWDAVVEYRNEPVDEDDEDDGGSGDEEEEVVLYDRFGDELPETEVFAEVAQFEDLDGWEPIEPVDRNDLQRWFTFQSHVFTVYVTARFDSTGEGLGGLSREDQLAVEARGTNLVRAVACTVWRRTGDEGFQVVPITRWEELEYVPIPVLDEPEEGR